MRDLATVAQTQHPDISLEMLYRDATELLLYNHGLAGHDPSAHAGDSGAHNGAARPDTPSTHDDPEVVGLLHAWRQVATAKG